MISSNHVFLTAAICMIIPFLVAMVVWLRSLLSFAEKYKQQHPKSDVMMRDISDLFRKSKHKGIMAGITFQSRVTESLNDPLLKSSAQSVRRCWYGVVLSTLAGFGIAAVILFTHPN